MDPSSPSELAPLPTWLPKLINAQPSERHLGTAANDGIPDGSRNCTLASLAGSLRAKGLGEAALQAALLEHNREHCSPPLDDDEVRQIARSISNYPPGSPNDVLRTLTDAGNAKRFAQRYAKTIRYVPEWGKWITWQQTHWGIDGAGAVIELAKAAVDAIYEEGNLLSDADLRVAVAKHAKSSASAARLKAMVELASSEGDLVVHASELDRHRGLLGVQNGTLNLSTGKLQPASSDDYITMLAPVSFDAQADCPTFRQFLLQIMDGNQELVDYLQRMFGYALSGYTSEQYLYFFYGTGANGKSTLLAVFRDLLGHRYYLTLPSEAIMVRPGKSGATAELARLPGARVVVTNEIEDGTWLAESLVKLLTGGDRIAARHLYQEIFEFEPQFKLVIAGNHKPVVRNDDYGIWRRIQLVPFEVTIPTDQRDPNLPDKLRSELPGVLNWALHGYHQWRMRGLSPPAAVTGAVETYRKEMDLFGQWLEECCDLNAELETTAVYAYACFKNWSGFNGFKGWTNARFGRKVKERFQSRRTADSTLYKGFGVKKDADIFWPRV